MEKPCGKSTKLDALMPVTKDEILGALPSLSHADLLAVQALASALVGGVGAALSLQGAACFNALVSALGAQITYSAIEQTKTGKLFIKRLPDFIKFLDANFAGWDSNKLTQMAFLRMIFCLIKEDLQKRDVTPSLGMVVSNMLRIRDVFELAFPGYLSAGMGEVILKGFK